MPKNWKTTLAGGVLGGLVIAGNVVSDLQTQGKPINWSNIGLGLGVILIGLLAKDHNVTGGTVVQPSVVPETKVQPAPEITQK